MKKNFWMGFAAVLTAMMLCLNPVAAVMAETAGTAEAEQGAEVPVLLATVNGEEILSDNSDLQELISYYTEYYASYGYDTTDASMQASIQAAGLEWAIESALYRQKAQALNVADITEEQLASLQAAAKAEWDAAVDYYAGAVGGMTDASTEEEKATARATALDYIRDGLQYTEESYVSSYVEGMRQVQLRTNVQNAVLGEIEVTDEEIAAHFNEMVEEDKENYEGNIAMYEYYTQYMGNPSYYVPEGYRGITHILLKVDEDLLNNYKNLTAELEEQQEEETADPETEGTDTAETAAAAETAEAGEGAAEESGEPAAEKEKVTQEMVDAARQAVMDSVQGKVDDIRTRYQAGTPFADLIAEFGEDPGMTQEPNRTNGYAVHKDSILFDPAFTEGAMTLEKIGDISEPVLGNYGVHILHYTRDIPAGAVELTDEIRQQLREELHDELETAAVNTMMIEWKAESDIQYTEEGLKLMSALSGTENESVEATEATEQVLSGEEENK